MINIGIWNLFTKFDAKTVGTKVTNPRKFLEGLQEAVERFDFSICRQPGQGVIKLSDFYCNMVSAGVGLRTDNPEDYIARVHRGKVGVYLKRKFAVPADSVSAVVYTSDAYVNDPESTKEEIERVKSNNYTHILVDVLASAGPTSPLTPWRFVCNLAGGNNEALDWTGDEIRDMAKEIVEYYNRWCMVAD